MILASVLVLALLAGGGFITWWLLRGATPAAAKGIPSNALAVLEVNLNPSAGDKLAVKEVAAKFPLLKDEANDAGDDYKKERPGLRVRGEAMARRFRCIRGSSREGFREQVHAQYVCLFCPGH